MQYSSRYDLHIFAIFVLFWNIKRRLHAHLSFLSPCNYTFLWSNQVFEHLQKLDNERKLVQNQRPLFFVVFFLCQEYFWTLWGGWAEYIYTLSHFPKRLESSQSVNKEGLEVLKMTFALAACPSLILRTINKGIRQTQADRSNMTWFIWVFIFFLLSRLCSNCL